jgi:hypothetical protein
MYYTLLHASLPGTQREEREEFYEHFSANPSAL